MSHYWNQGVMHTEVCLEMMPRLYAQLGVFRIGTYVDTENQRVVAGAA